LEFTHGAASCDVTVMGPGGVEMLIVS
jgi:hypothetical protein